MNRHSDGVRGAEAQAAIDLAHEPRFRLGRLTIAPAELVVEADGWSQRLEPRVMQVLITLAKASPAVVGRADLNSRVWSGRIVGDDAINRAVQTLRRLAADAPPPAPFAIETIPRVGYRLTAAADTAADLSARRILRLPHAWRWFGTTSAIIAALLLWRIFGVDHAERATWRIVQATVLDDLPPDARDVVLSPDGRRLAYRGEDEQHRERIFLRAVQGGGIGSPVSPAAIDARHPAWSPDGAALAFAAYDAARPCSLYVLRPPNPASLVGSCETVREPHLTWSADGRSLLFGDAPGVNAVTRISSVSLADGRRTVLGSPPGDSSGDDLPVRLGRELAFQRTFALADEGWIARDLATGRERLLWRRRGVAGSAAAPLPGGALAIAWTRAGSSGIDVIGSNGRASSQPVALGPVTALSAAGKRLLVEVDRSETSLARGDGAEPLATVHGRITGPTLLPDGRLRIPVTSAGVARIWERDRAGSLRPWGAFVAAFIAGVALSPDGRLTAALVTGDAGREIVMFDPAGRPIRRWNPHARSLNPAAWSADGRRLIAPVLDGAGWRLFALDPFGHTAPRDLGLPGFALVLARGPAMYAVRAGEATGVRELWRLDGDPRRLPIDLTLYDIVNWRPVDAGVWLPDRSDREHPRLVLRDETTGRVLRRVDAPGLAGPRSGLAADARGPIYVKISRDAPEYGLVTLSASGSRD